MGAGRGLAGIHCEQSVEKQTHWHIQVQRERELEAVVRARAGVMLGEQWGARVKRRGMQSHEEPHRTCRKTYIACKPVRKGTQVLF